MKKFTLKSDKVFLHFLLNPLSVLIFLIKVFLIPVYGESLTMTTYYPPPIGAYDRIRLMPRAQIGGNSCSLGSMYVNKDNNSLVYFCHDDMDDGEWGLLQGVWTQSIDDIYLTDTTYPFDKKVAIGTTLTEFKLTLDNDGGIIANDIFPLGDNQYTTLPNLSPGARFIWYPKKAAIRAGEVTGTQWDDANIGNHSVAFGLDNQASGNASVVAGGAENVAGVQYGTIGGGFQNKAIVSPFATIGGGQNNQAQGTHSFIGGGQDNTVAGAYSAVLGGNGNNSAGDHTVIGGGGTNQITVAGDYGAIVGGQNNIVSAGYSTIGGGFNNAVQTEYATIGGGHSNIIKGWGDYGTILGGHLNELWSPSGVIAGGYKNLAHADITNFIGGGSENLAWDGYAAVVGGSKNRALADYSFVGGGLENDAGGDYSVVGGGFKNWANGRGDFIGGGNSNHSVGAGKFSVIPGGLANYINIVGGILPRETYNLVAGSNMRLMSGEKTFIWGNSPTPVDITASNAFIIYNGNVGIGTITPTERLHVMGNMLAKSGRVVITNAPTLSSGVPLKKNGSGVIGNDLAEIFETSEAVEMGDLLVIDQTQKGKFKRSERAYDKKIVGVVSSLPAIMFEGNQLQLSPQTPFIGGNKAPVALAGRVSCKVSLENGPIRYGDLLTSSSTSGHAMKAERDRKKSFGKVLGKALETFTGGPHGETTGLITIFVTLQ